jgi:hypothetical protein
MQEENKWGATTTFFLILINSPYRLQRKWRLATLYLLETS